MSNVIPFPGRGLRVVGGKGAADRDSGDRDSRGRRGAERGGAAAASDEPDDLFAPLRPPSRLPATSAHMDLDGTGFDDLFAEDDDSPFETGVAPERAAVEYRDDETEHGQDATVTVLHPDMGPRGVVRAPAVRGRVQHAPGSRWSSTLDADEVARTVLGDVLDARDRIGMPDHADVIVGVRTDAAVQVLEVCVRGMSENEIYMDIDEPSGVTRFGPRTRFRPEVAELRAAIEAIAAQYQRHESDVMRGYFDRDFVIRVTFEPPGSLEYRLREEAFAQARRRARRDGKPAPTMAEFSRTYDSDSDDDGPDIA